jgi:hypothetical protein
VTFFRNISSKLLQLKILQVIIVIQTLEIGEVRIDKTLNLEPEDLRPVWLLNSNPFIFSVDFLYNFNLY